MPRPFGHLAYTTSPADAKAARKKKGLIKFRGRLLTREEVELARLEHRVDEDYKALAGRYHSRRLARRAWTAWWGRIRRSRLLRLRCDSVRQAHVKRCKARYWSVLLAMWLKTLMARRREASRDRGIGAWMPRGAACSASAPRSASRSRTNKSGRTT